MNTTVVKRISFLRRKSSQIGYGQLDTSLTTLSVVYLAAKMRPCSATSVRCGRPHEKVGTVFIHPLRVRADPDTFGHKWSAKFFPSLIFCASSAVFS